MSRHSSRALCGRRSFLQTTAAIVGGALAARPTSAAPPAARLIATDVISAEPHIYHGWPTICRRKNGQLLLVWSGGREAHVCPFGRVDWMTSNDNGKTWTWPRTLLDSDIDDRDAGVLETEAGSILVTTFSSLAWEPVLQRAEQQTQTGNPGDWPEERLARWRAARDRLPEAARKAELGRWMIRSTDGGITWSARYSVPLNSPHGPIPLSDGRLLYAGKGLWAETAQVGVSLSADDGVTWGEVIEIPPRPGDDPEQYHELHAVEAGDGRIIVHVRNHNPQNERETLQTHSEDGGQTWAVPYSIDVWGLPSHLLRLRDGRLLMTYGHRRAPRGNQARVSRDGGRSWSEPIILSGDGASGDLGYPSTVELDDGELLTVWYEKPADRTQAELRQARWQLEG
ncbi:MAG: exo-alpha-sialidase [Planctomycetaceae bacterium]|nr:exo-alpha-sialidase [Planctomycetaceae bacterium]